MGILLKKKKSKNHNNIKSDNESNITFSKKKNKKLINIKNDNENNNNIIIEDIEENKEKILYLKIHIVGTGEKKQYVINNLFKKDITNDDIKNNLKVTKEFKTEQFHWIAHVYEDAILNNDICKDIENEIKADRKKKDNEKIMIKSQVILCFGNENTEILSKNFKNFRKSNMIFVTETKCQLNEIMDKRYATNIILKDIENNKEKLMSNEDLNANIISVLWELDCYFKEKDNIICRYTPEKIFNGLENDNSLFTLNILLIGLSRAGKSTFINMLSRKLSALESDLASSVTKNITEYYIYKKDDQKKQSPIKLIDTPGLVPNKNDNNLEEIIRIIKNENQSIEKKIHFIFFIIMHGQFSLEGDNITKVFDALNKTKIPMFFIINKVKKNIDFKELIIPIKQHFNSKGFNNLSKDENFIGANFIKGTTEEIHGINNIFSKIRDYFKEKNYLDKNLKLEMDKLLRDFTAQVESDNSFLCLTDEDEKISNKLKQKINLDERMNKIIEKQKNNELFQNLIIDSLIENGRKTAERCRNCILSLSNLRGILPNISKDLPAISIYQAFMVKEIGLGYGLDIDVLNSGTKFLMKHIEKKLPALGKEIKEKEIKEKEIKEKKKEKKEKEKENINKINVNDFMLVLEKKASDILESSKDTVISLAKLLDKINKANLGSDKGDDENDNAYFSNSVYEYCTFYFEKKIKESKGLCFLINYYNNFNLFFKDIDYYIQKQDWDKYEVEIKK